MAFILHEKIMKPLIAEFIGSFLLVFCGPVTGILSGEQLAVSLVFGIVLKILAETLGSYSGGNFNPWVTLGTVMNGSFNQGEKLVPGYLLVQFLGGMLAASFIWILFPGQLEKAATLPSVSYGFWSVLWVEFLITLVLLFSILQTTSTTVIGGALFLGVFIGFKVSGGSLNLVRTLPFMILLGNFNGFWAYFFGQFLATLVAVGITKLLK